MKLMYSLILFSPSTISFLFSYIIWSKVNVFAYSLFSLSYFFSFSFFLFSFPSFSFIVWNKTNIMKTTLQDVHNNFLHQINSKQQIQQPKTTKLLSETEDKCQVSRFKKYSSFMAIQSVIRYTFSVVYDCTVYFIINKALSPKKLHIIYKVKVDGKWNSLFESDE